MAEKFEPKYQKFSHDDRKVVHMQKTEGGIPTCVSCKKPLTYLRDKNSWRCLDCRPFAVGEEDYEFKTDAPICKTQNCKKPCSRLEVRRCWRCFHCNPWLEEVSVEEPSRKYVDEAMTEEKVAEIVRKTTSEGGLTADDIRKIVQKELQDWLIPKPPVTKDEVAKAASIGSETKVVKVNKDTVKAKNVPVKKTGKTNSSAEADNI